MTTVYEYTGPKDPNNFYKKNHRYPLTITQNKLFGKTLKAIRIEVQYKGRDYMKAVPGSERKYKNQAEFNRDWERVRGCQKYE